MRRSDLDLPPNLSRRSLLLGLGAGLLAQPALAAPSGRLADLGAMQSIRTAYEDTMLDIALSRSFGFVELMAANPGVDPWIPGEGTEIVLPGWHLLPNAPQRGLVVNLGDMRIYQFRAEGARSYPIGIGRDGLLTPRGETKIVRKNDNPSWYPTPRMRKDDPTLPAMVPPGPDNPLGTRALYLGWPSYLIHGTHKPDAIGRRSSSGCIRMYPWDVEEIFPTVAVGSAVTVVDQPVKLATIDGAIWLEAHPTQTQADHIEAGEPMPMDVPVGFTDQVMALAGNDLQRLDWTLVRQAVVERRGYPVKISR